MYYSIDKNYNPISKITYELDYRNNTVYSDFSKWNEYGELIFEKVHTEVYDKSVIETLYNNCANYLCTQHDLKTTSQINNTIDDSFNDTYYKDNNHSKEYVLNAIPHLALHNELYLESTYKHAYIENNTFIVEFYTFNENWLKTKHIYSFDYQQNKVDIYSLKFDNDGLIIEQSHKSDNDTAYIVYAYNNYLKAMNYSDMHNINGELNDSNLMLDYNINGNLIDTDNFL